MTRPLLPVNVPHWRDAETIQKRYERLCKQLRLPRDAYSLTFTPTDNGLKMGFRKNTQTIEAKRLGYGKNIIITDNHGWSTADIIQAALDRWQVEERFRLSKDDDLVGVQPVRHWTDRKIRCHLFTCVVIAKLTPSSAIEQNLS